MTNKYRTLIFVAIGLAGTSALVAFGLCGVKVSPEEPIRAVNNSRPGAPSVSIVSEASGTDHTGERGESGLPAAKKLPEKFLIDVPFTSQAPYANWDPFHEEACEEASLIMLVYFLRQQKLDQETAEREILGLIRHEIKKYGDYEDSTAEEIVTLARDYYGLTNLKVVYDFSLQDLKAEIAKGNPVILPAAGRALDNPNFKQPGPLYHVLVLIGYDRDKLITNDPGTRKGRHYAYPADTLYSAIHDFPGDKDRILEGRKAMIVVADGSGR